MLLQSEKDFLKAIIELSSKYNREQKEVLKATIDSSQTKEELAQKLFITKL